MEKQILRKDEAKANELMASIETNVLPVVKSLADKLTALGIDSDAKQRIAELFAGNYSTIEAEYRAKLEKDAALFQSPSAQEGVLSQLHEVMADLKEFVAEELGRISYKDAAGIKLTDPAILDYLEFKKGVPVVGKEQKAAIFEHFTTYVQTEVGAEFRKQHLEAVAALNRLWQSCGKVGVRFMLPIQFLGVFLRYAEDGFIPAEIDYDNLAENAIPAENVAEETEVIRTPLQEPRFIDVSGKTKTLSAQGIR